MSADYLRIHSRRQGIQRGGRRNVGRPWLRYLDKVKSNLTAVQIDRKNFELSVNDRKAWRGMCRNGIDNFSASYIEKLRQTRLKTKASAKRPGALSPDPKRCDHCGLLCKSLAGLKCHLRLSPYPTKKLRDIVRTSYVETDGRVHHIYIYIPL